uniref:Uncharacterized protein n=1 Tax=Mesocestoides corti TaxID=53468 RepID=A0A5K3EUT0_MESCO
MWTATANGPTMDEESFLQVYKTKVPRQLFLWATILPDVGYGECRTGYFYNNEQCGEASLKLSWRQCGDRSGRRHIGQPGLSQSPVTLGSTGMRGR